MLKLVKLEEKHMPLLIDMMDEWYATGEKIVPYVIRKVDYHNFTTYSESLELKEARDGVRPSERRKGVATANDWSGAAGVLQTWNRESADGL